MTLSTVSIKAMRIDISPDRPIPIGGHGGAPILTRRTHGALEANIVVLGEASEAVVLISIDTLFAGAPLTERLTQACASIYGVGPDRILILASHTHFAPMLDPAKPGLGATDPAELDRWSDAIIRALPTSPGRQAASVRIGRSVSDHSVNRRLRWRTPTLVRWLGKVDGDIYNCDNPDGPRDPRIRTCVWLSADNQPLAALWSFACHPVSFPEQETSSADYIGVVREALRSRLGVNLPVIFAPGCMGDVRPRSPQPWKTPDRAASIAIYGPSPRPFTPPEWRSWSRGVAQAVVDADADGVTEAIGEAPHVMPMVRLPLDAILDGTSPTPELHAKAMRLPGLGRIISLSCEPVSQIANLVSDDPEDLVLGYEGDVFGYLPTDAMVREGGYEARRFMSSFGLKGAFRSGIDAQIAEIGRRLRS